MTTLDLSSFDTAGGVVKIFKGPGAADETNWRWIEDQSQSGSNDYFLAAYADDWGTTHTTATEFATMGVDFWQEITGHGLTARVTDVLVVGDYVYFAQGDTTPIRRGRWTETGSMATAAIGPGREASRPSAPRALLYSMRVPTAASAQRVGQRMRHIEVFSARLGDKLNGSNPLLRRTGLRLHRQPATDHSHGLRMVRHCAVGFSSDEFGDRLKRCFTQTR
jgi:hypothetical protein